jgi:aldehyde:ferredoxin oxidoreductase
MKGYMGNILRVDLTKGTAVSEKLDERLARDFLGGRGLGSKVLYDEMRSGVDPLSPENVMIFAVGPLTGTRTPCSGRHVVVSKSPATGGIAFTSSGGTWGAELKKAGFDAIIVKGKAAKPTYLWISDESVRFMDAGEHWGKKISQSDEEIRSQTDPSAKVLQIGIAGENKSGNSAIMNEKYRAAGRCGLGAVMGSKNLKAIAVKGTKNPEAADSIGLSRVIDRSMKMIAASDVTREEGGLNSYGTAVLTNIMNASGIYPTRNFQTGTFADADKISGEQMSKTILKEKKACFECPIECGRWIKLEKGKYAGTEGESLEYETSWAFGGQCGVNNLEALARANFLCNEYGLDTISTGSSIGFTMELMERGILTNENVGIDLRFGDHEAMLRMIEMIANREGFGDVLADGTRAAAKRIGKGSIYYTMQVKGLELPAYDPRGVFGLGLNYATGNRGACHVTGYTIAAEILGVPLKADPFDAGEDKVDLTILFQDLTAAIDSSSNCLFLAFAISAQEYADMIKHLVGWKDYTPEEFMRAGERIFAIERLFNKREGFGRKDDTLPERFLKEPMPEGAPKGNVHPLTSMLDIYYRKRGYDNEGHPAGEKLEELGITG